MTFIGKMLIVVQLVLSLLFMAFAGAVFTVEQNWKQQFTDKDQDLKTEQDFHKSTQNKFNEYKNVKSAKVAELDTLSKKRLSDFTREKNRADNLQQQLNITPKHVDILHRYAKFVFEWGRGLWGQS